MHLPMQQNSDLDFVAFVDVDVEADVDETVDYVKE